MDVFSKVKLNDVFFIIRFKMMFITLFSVKTKVYLTLHISFLSVLECELRVHYFF